MSKWAGTAAKSLGGIFRIVITKPGRPGVDVTFFRGVPTVLTSFSDADPYGDAVAQITFPQVTGFDDFDSPDVGAWLGGDSNVDIYFIPGVAAAGYPTPSAPYASDASLYTDPLTNTQDVVAPFWNYSGGARTTRAAKKVFEGYVASLEMDADASGQSLQMQCSGALFQADGYKAKPFYPSRPQPLESLIANVFSHTYQPHLRTSPLQVLFPEGWSKVAPAYPPGGATEFTPVVTPGTAWTGYSSRSTGSWDNALTSYVSGMLANMITDAVSGVASGNQWTVLMDHDDDGAGGPGRTPVLQVRDTNRTPDFDLWYGAPGVTCQLTSDSTQEVDLVYGTGTAPDGTSWKNAQISPDGTRTDYLPLAFGAEDYPYQGNPTLDLSKIIREAYVQYGTGFDQASATVSAQQNRIRNSSTGWSGTITLQSDPSTELLRWLIRSGMTVRFQGFAGTGASGVNFHIAQVERDVSASGQVTLTVDTKYRDLLTVNEALARNRDPLTAVLQLQAGQASQLVEDVMAPWNYAAGSGCIPNGAKWPIAVLPTTAVFPYSAAYAKTYPPAANPTFYVPCNANASTRAKRWTASVPVLMSEKGSIRRSEFFVVDRNGNAVDCPFHVSLYYNNVTSANMPYDGGGPSPFIAGAFSKVNPATGQTWDQPNLTPDQSFIIGWGVLNEEAGYWPGAQSIGSPATGLLVDEDDWTFDNTTNGRFNVNAKPGQAQTTAAITIYAIFYAEWPTPVYFVGRLFRDEPGV